MKYIKHLDGLRAFAVLLVVIYHAGINLFGGGFIGVDIFFVLSGFLIYKVLIESSSRQNWIRDFYLSRFRRIVPIYWLMMVVVAVLSAALYLPVHLEKMWPSFLSGFVFLSNFVFWRTTSYFSPDLAYNPILHSWSLAVEWQFYAVAPLIFLIFGQNKKAFRNILFLAFVGSFFMSAGLVAASKPTAAFYLLPSRLWEFLIGFYAAQFDATRIPDRLKSALSWSALGVIIACATLYSHGTAFPGLAAVPVTLAAAVLITCGAGGSVGAFLGNRVAATLGQASYSIYIWHWPIIVMLDYRFQRGVQLSESSRLLLIIFASLLVGLISWKFVETPWRDRSRFPNKKLFRQSFFVAGFAFMICVLFAVKLLPTPFSKEAIAYAEAYSDAGDFRRCLKYIPSADGGYEDLCKLGAEDAAGHDFLLIGDSHAAALADGVSLIAKEQGKSGLLAATDACPPFFDFEGGYAPSRAKCKELQNNIVALVKKYAPEKVLLHASWGAYERRDPEAFRRQLMLVAKELKGLGVEVFFLGDTPGYRDNVPVSLAKSRDFGWVLNPYSVSEHEKMYSGARRVINEAQAEFGFVHFDFAGEMCSANVGCGLLYDGYPLYWDNAHLTGTSSVALARLLQTKRQVF